MGGTKSHARYGMIHDHPIFPWATPFPASNISHHFNHRVEGDKRRTIGSAMIAVIQIKQNQLIPQYQLYSINHSP